MKKIILVVLALVSLITAGIGGYAYAATTHTPVSGNKIVGLGLLSDNDQTQWDTSTPPVLLGGYRERMNFNVILLNPNCDTTMTINQISLIGNNGTLVYEWKLSDDPSTWPEGLILGDIPPHGEWLFASGKSIMDNNFDLPNLGIVTLEISYSTKSRKYLPLQGTVIQVSTRQDAVSFEGDPGFLVLEEQPQYRMMTTVPMVNY